MIDLHCHILAGVDDGAASEAESCMMAQLAVDSGVRTIAATPHFDPRRGEERELGRVLKESFCRLERLLCAQEIPLELRSGMEVFSTTDTPRLLREGCLLTLGGSRYLLLEFGFDSSAAFAEHILEEVRAQGAVPVVAHPERYRFVQQRPELLYRWLERGCVLQVNKGSFFGRFGRRAARTAHWCLREGCLHLIASDAHSPYQRTPRLSDIHEYISETASQAAADLLLSQNPAHILADRPVQSAATLLRGGYDEDL